MTEAMEQEYEVVLDLPEETSDIEENPFRRSDLVAGVEYAVGAMAGFAVSDLASAALETNQKAFFLANPMAWWAIPIVKFVAGALLLYFGQKVKGPDAKRIMTGFSVGIFADIANDLIMGFQVDQALGIERNVFIQVGA